MLPSPLCNNLYLYNNTSLFTFTPQKHFKPKPKLKFPVFCSSQSSDTLPAPQSAIHRIAEKLRSLGIAEHCPTPNPHSQNPQNPQNPKPGEIFIPLPTHLPKYRVGHTLDPSWSTPEHPVPVPGTGGSMQRLSGFKREVREESVPTLAELRLDKAELRRLRRIGIALNTRIKIGKAGITEGIVNGIHERWRNSEVVKIVCDDICRLNMKRTHDMLERKTGGLVVWRSGYKIVLYRGANYKYPYFSINTSSENDDAQGASSSGETSDDEHDKMESSKKNVEESAMPSPTSQTRPTLIKGVGSPDRVRFQLPGERELAEEADRLLDGLGPRFTDWWGYEPLPVDADRLPAIVPGFRRPFRLLPYGVSAKLTNDEMTTLKRLGRPLPCHFALGRNRKLQGLAAAIIKLWERCEIVKIVVKRGVQNTNSEMMAEELKQLTGGTLLSRDQYFIVLYRGKDFLPAAVSSAIEKRRKQLTKTVQSSENGNTDHASENELDKTDNDKRLARSEERKVRSMRAAFERTGMKLSKALEKKSKAEKLLAELENGEISQQSDIDREGITEEERFMLRKVGLKMKPFLLLGRLGVFAGTVENMHLHWKYRELVKIICKEKSTEAVHQVAQTLEAESGGILVAVERVSKGYAIIVYRGKNYRRPSSIRPQTLLTKRAAKKRSLEAQRRESLKLHVLKLTKHIDGLKNQLAKSVANGAEVAVESENQLVKENVIHQQAAEARESGGGGSTFTGLHHDPDALANNLDDPHLAKLINFPIMNGRTKDAKSEEDSAFGSVIEDDNASLSLGTSGQAGASDSTFCPDTVKEEPGNSVTNETKHDKAIRQSVNLDRSQQGPSAQKLVNDVSYEMHCRPVHLSNKERLLLRKQALKMKKRPVIAVGKSNDVTGVAKTIKAHFQKHPLAIVNVKGRAKGTSVQEVVFKLEQATGAVLVSQEPSKVILYRGWEAGDEPMHYRRSTRDVVQSPEDMNTGAWPAASPDLMAAIRLECGLNQKLEESKT